MLLPPDRPLVLRGRLVQLEPPTSAASRTRRRSASISRGDMRVKRVAMWMFWRSTRIESIPLTVVTTGRLIA